MEPVLDKGAEQGSGGFGAQSQPFVDEGVHLLFDDVRSLADGAGKQLGFLKERQSYFRKAEAVEDASGFVFNVLPKDRFARQDVLKALDGLDVQALLRRRKNEKRARQALLLWEIRLVSVAKN